MKYIKKFKTDSEFQSFKGSKDYVTPNISHIVETENNILRENIKFTIDGKEYNAGKHMTWEEWIGHDNHAHYNNDFFTLRNGEVINREALNIYETIGNSETFNKEIIPQNIYFAATGIKSNKHKTLYYTSSDNNIIAINTDNFNAGNVISHTYENGVGCVIFEKNITQIGSSAFQKCTTLTSITIPNSVTSIGESAFSGCTGLKTITIPDSVTSIGQNAFMNCSGITGELYLPDSVTWISRNAFYGCTGLTTLRLPHNNLEMKEEYQIFYGCKGITGEVDIPYGWKIIPKSMFSGCSGITKVNIPNTVSKIGRYAFYGCSNLTGELTIPDSVTTIVESAFMSCSGLTSIRFSNNLQSIGDGAFYGCNGLSNIVIPDSVTVFSGAPFQSCRGLESVIIGNGIKELGRYCFRYCSNLHTVVLPDTLTVIGSSAFNSCSNLTNINMPNDLITIEDQAFSGCKSLSGELILPAKLQILGADAFSGCSSISSVRILSDFLTIGYDNLAGCTINPFSSCSSITEFISKYSYFDNTTLIINNELIAVAPASSLSELVIPDGVIKVAGSAAYNCRNLKRLVLPNTLTAIGSLAFDSSGITYELDVPTSVSEIKSQAFHGTPLQKVNVHSVVPCSNISLSFDSDVNFYVADNFIDLYKEQWSSRKNYIFGNGTSITNTTTFIYTTTDGQIIAPANYVIVNNEYENGSGTLEVLGTITVINKEFNLPNLESLIIPDGVTHITSKAFENCTTIKNITIPDSVISIGQYAFYGCSGLTNVVIPDSVTNIEPYTFYNCSGLTGELTIPDSVISIGDYAFYNCSGLTSELIIPDSVASIGQYSFYGCSGLTGELYLPDSVTWISRNAFYGCSGFTGTLTISNRVTQIGSGVFYGCSGITNIIFPNNLTMVGANAFSGCTGLTNVVIPESVTEFADNVFSNCTNLTSLTIPQHLDYFGKMQSYSVPHITIPNGITKLQNSHFSGCTNLKSITLPDTLNYIDLGAFYGCKNLERVNISDISAWCQIKHYDDDANPLYYAKNLYLNGELLTNLVIPEGTTHINEYAFYNCQSLQSVTLPVSLQTIGKDAFSGCKNLERVNISDIGAWCQISSSGTTANPLYYAKNLYLNGELLTNLVIPEGTTHINEYAFYNCSGLTGDINLPNSITNIGNYAFYGCSNLTGAINIPAGVTNIEPYTFYNCSGLTGELTIPDSVVNIGECAFYGCSGFTGELTIPDSVETINSYAFAGCSELTSITLGKNVNNLKSRVFQSCNKVKEITSNNMTAPDIVSDTFSGFSTGGTVFCPVSSIGYDNWMINGLTSQKWELKEPYEINSYFDLQITADNVKTGRQTKTTVHWTCGIDGTNLSDNLPVVKQLSGTGISNEFPQNLSETETVEREITFEYHGLTATTTITQGVWVHQNYEVILNDNWEKSATISNPDEDLYDGVYQSFSNKGVNSTAAIMYIDIVGYENFKFYIRSYAESNYDYVMVSQLDTDINNDTSYSNTSLVKTHTRGKSTSGTVISNYTLVEFTGLDKGEHRITVVYRKDGSSSSGDDRGYVLIPFEQ